MDDWIDLFERIDLQGQEAVGFIHEQLQKDRDERQEETDRRREEAELRREEDERSAEFRSEEWEHELELARRPVTLSPGEMRLTAEGMQSDHMGRFLSCQLLWMEKTIWTAICKDLEGLQERTTGSKTRGLVL